MWRGLMLMAVVFLSGTPCEAGQDLNLNRTPASAQQEKPSAPAKVNAATKVRSAIHVRLVGDSIRYAVDTDLATDSLGFKLDGTTLAASVPIKVIYPKLNPLKVQATASVSAVDDPSHAIVTQLIQAIAGIPAVVAPATPETVTTKARRLSQDPNCATYREARQTLLTIQRNLYTDTVSADGLRRAFAAWQKAIQDELDGSGLGPRAMSKGVDSVEETRKAIGDALKLAFDAIDNAKKHAADSQETPARRLYNGLAGELRKDATNNATSKQTPQSATLARLQAEADAADECAAETATLYGIILLANPEARLADLRKLEKSIKSLGETLAGYANGDKWLNDTGYVLAVDVTPATDKLQRVAVKAQTIAVDAGDGQLSLTHKDVAVATFDIQQYSRFVPELGVGATFGFVRRPKYGTAKDATGQTVVALASEEDTSVDPAVMVNFVPRGMAGAVPFVQLGASASKSSPAVFIGGGWRVPGTGDGGMGVGLGLMLAWVKDLKKLRVGDVVSGTSDIEADFKYDSRPKRAFYLNLQYKF